MKINSYLAEASSSARRHPWWNIYKSGLPSRRGKSTSRTWRIIYCRGNREQSSTVSRTSRLIITTRLLMMLSPIKEVMWPGFALNTCMTPLFLHTYINSCMEKNHNLIASGWQRSEGLNISQRTFLQICPHFPTNSSSGPFLNGISPSKRMQPATGSKI